jgi:diacylglycerol kinase (ATP)
MRILLLHNPRAGSGEPDAETLTRAFRQEGHRVRYHSTKAGEALDQPADVIALAGGDGTLRKIFRKLAGRPRIPVLALALGTANNIARSLGCSRPWKESIAALQWLDPHPFQFGRINCGTSEDCFFESVGTGVFATLLHLAERDPRFIDLLSRGRKGFERDFAALARLAADMPSMEILLSSETGEFRDHCLWMEVMNIPSIGPHLEIAPVACMEPGPGVHIVLVPQAYRQALVSYFEIRMNHGEASFPGIHWKWGPEVTISCPGGEYHVDDEPETTTDDRPPLIISRATDPLIVLGHRV